MKKMYAVCRRPRLQNYPLTPEVQWCANIVIYYMHVVCRTKCFAPLSMYERYHYHRDFYAIINLASLMKGGRREADVVSQIGVTFNERPSQMIRFNIVHDLDRGKKLTFQHKVLRIEDSLLHSYTWYKLLATLHALDSEMWNVLRTDAEGSSSAQ